MVIDAVLLGSLSIYKVASRVETKKAGMSGLTLAWMHKGR